MSRLLTKNYLVFGVGLVGAVCGVNLSNYYYLTFIDSVLYLMVLALRMLPVFLSASFK